jgi:hypothetical protein
LGNLVSKQKNTPLDLLYEANLLDPYEGSVYLKSFTGKSDMFFLESVGSSEEMHELSVLQALLMAYNIVTPGKDIRGLWLLACGFFSLFSFILFFSTHSFSGITKGNGNPLHERAQTKTYSPEMRLILETLLHGFQVLELRFSRWVEKVTHKPHYLHSQKEMSKQWDAAFEGKERNVPKHQCLIQENWLTLARGTTIHLDKANFGLSIAFYLGFGWSNTDQVGVGIPELRFIWKHRCGSVMAIRGWQWYHMSLKFIGDILKMMNACFVNSF